MSKTCKIIIFYPAIFLMIMCQKNPYRQGKNLYGTQCESCHMEDGSGLEKLIPALSSSTMIRTSPDSLVCLIRHGIPVNPATGQEMPPNIILNEVELANLINYLRASYSTEPRAVKVDEIKTWLTSCQSTEN